MLKISSKSGHKGLDLGKNEILIQFDRGDDRA